MNYRTVISFGPRNIEYLMKKYETYLEVPNKKGIKEAHIGGLASGYSVCQRFIFMAIMFYLSALIIDKESEGFPEKI